MNINMYDFCRCDWPIVAATIDRCRDIASVCWRCLGVDGSKSRVSLDSASDKLSSSQLVHLNTPQPISSTAVKLSWFVRRHQRYIQGFVVKHRPLLGNDDDRASGHVTEVRVAGGDVTSYTLEGLDKYTWYEVSIQPFFRSVIGRQSSAQVRTLDDGAFTCFLMII